MKMRQGWESGNIEKAKASWLNNIQDDLFKVSNKEYYKNDGSLHILSHGFI